MAPVNASIRFEKVTKVYRGGIKERKVALQEFSLEILPGEVFGLLGPNGAGKSTAIKILLNLLYPTRGTAWILDRPVHDPMIRQRVGYLPENLYLYDHLTPSEVLWFGGKTSGLSSAQIHQRAKELLRMVELVHVKKWPLRTFSKGMLQRMALALALVNDPAVIILDEPMSGLDPIGRKLVSDIIRRMRSEGRTVFFSTHILPDVEDLCDRVGILVKSELRWVSGLTDLGAGPPRGWRMMMKNVTDAVKHRITGLGWKFCPRGSAIEIEVPELDLYKSLEQLRSLGCELVSVTPLKETLEDIFLREIEKAGGQLPV